MKALVTGGSGFIGSHLLKTLEGRGHQVVNYDVKNIKDFDILNYTSLRGALHKVDVVFHLAGVLGTSELMDRVISAEKINVLGTLHVLELCRYRGIPVVFASKINPVDWVNPYTITKRACDSYCQMYEEVWGLDICILKYLNVYGPGQKSYPVQKYVPTFIEKALKDEPLPVWGTGDQCVDPVYVEDIAEATVRAWEQKCWGKTIEIGLGQSMPVVDVAKKIIELTGSRSKILFLPMRHGEPVTPTTRLCADTFNMTTLLGLRPEDMTQPHAGLQKTVNWWKAQGKEATP